MITVQIGQCGNQVGQALFDDIGNTIKSNTKKISNNHSQKDLILNEFNERIMNEYFRLSNISENSLIARSVLIDMEPKVIENCLINAYNNGIYNYDKQNICTAQSGSANNWAFGYYKHGITQQDIILDKLRLEVEKTDYLHGFLLLQSLAGGTGIVIQ